MWSYTTKQFCLSTPTSSACDRLTISSDFNILFHRYSRNVPARTVYPGAFPADTHLIQLQLKVIATVEERMADVHLPSVLLLLCVEKISQEWTRIYRKDTFSSVKNENRWNNNKWKSQMSNEWICSLIISMLYYKMPVKKNIVCMETVWSWQSHQSHHIMPVWWYEGEEKW